MNQLVTQTIFNPHFFVCGNAYYIVSEENEFGLEALLVDIRHDNIKFVALKCTSNLDYDTYELVVPMFRIENGTVKIKKLIEE